MSDITVIKRYRDADRHKIGAPFLMGRVFHGGCRPDMTDADARGIEE